MAIFSERTSKDEHDSPATAEDFGSFTEALAVPAEFLPRKKVAGFGDNHGCNPEFIKHDLMLIGAMTLEGKFNPRFPGVILQVGDVLDRGEHSKEIFFLWRELQQQAPDQVVRLCGNHDLYHLVGCPWVIRAQPIEGIQEKLIEDAAAGTIRAAWAEGDVLYSHAGLDLRAFPEYRGKPLSMIEQDLNRRFTAAVRNMRIVQSLGDADYNSQLMDSDPIFGDDGIFWTRSDIENAQFRQVVGHTPQLDGIRAAPGLRVKYIDAGRIFGEEADDLANRLSARRFMLSTFWGPEVHRQFSAR